MVCGHYTAKGMQCHTQPFCACIIFCLCNLSPSFSVTRKGFCGNFMTFNALPLLLFPYCLSQHRTHVLNNYCLNLAVLFFWAHTKNFYKGGERYPPLLFSTVAKDKFKCVTFMVPINLGMRGTHIPVYEEFCPVYTLGVFPSTSGISLVLLYCPSLTSQPTSARREGSGEQSIQLLSRQNVISYAMFVLRLCDRGIISRCSTTPGQSGHANSETLIICSTRLPGPSWQHQVLTQLGQCHHVVILTHWKN